MYFYCKWEYIIYSNTDNIPPENPNQAKHCTNVHIPSEFRTSEPCTHWTNVSPKPTSTRDELFIINYTGYSSQRDKRCKGSFVVTELLERNSLVVSEFDVSRSQCTMLHFHCVADPKHQRKFSHPNICPFLVKFSLSRFRFFFVWVNMPYIPLETRRCNEDAQRWHRCFKSEYTTCKKWFYALVVSTWPLCWRKTQIVVPHSIVTNIMLKDFKPFVLEIMLFSISLNFCPRTVPTEEQESIPVGCVPTTP